MDVMEKQPNEKRLIDAYALQNILLPITTALEHEYGSLGGAVSGCMKHIDNAPTVDAVSVVRCKDCKFGYWDSEPHDAMVCMRTKDGFWRSGNDFCSYGKRKEGAE